MHYSLYIQLNIYNDYDNYFQLSTFLLLYIIFLKDMNPILTAHISSMFFSGIYIVQGFAMKLQQNHSKQANRHLFRIEFNCATMKRSSVNATHEIVLDFVYGHKYG